MKPYVYIESSVISVNAARPSRDVVMLARQEITRLFWTMINDEFIPIISPAVLDEISQGDPEVARKRMESVDGWASLDYTNDVERLADTYFHESGLAENARVDMLHLAFSSIYRVDYLVTWNCKHIANAFVLRRLENVNEKLGVPMPRIHTPEEFVGHE